MMNMVVECRQETFVGSCRRTIYPWELHGCVDDLFEFIPPANITLSYITKSATQSPSPSVRIYHGIEIMPIGIRLDPKPSCFFGPHERWNSFVGRGNAFLPGRKSNPLCRKNFSRLCNPLRRYPVWKGQTV